MACFNCTCRCSCNLLVGIAALVIGIITAFLRITAVITVTPVFLWVALGAGAVFLAIPLATVPCRQCYNGCSSLMLLLLGALATLLLSGILLAIPFAATSVVGAILTGALLFSLSLTLGSSACYTLARCNDD